MSPFSIIILTMNALGRTISTIASVRRATEGLPVELIVVDNGSTDGLTGWLAAQPDIWLVANGRNLGVPMARNIGIRTARHDHLLFLDNDIDLKPHAIPMFDARLADPIVGMVGDAGSVLIPEWARGDITSHDTSDGDFPGNNFLVGYCMATRRDVIAAVGPFDEAYPLFYWEDIDYAIRVRKAGYDLAVISETCFHHRRATVASANRGEFVRQVEEEGKARTLDKHGRDCPTWALVEGGTDETVTQLEASLRDVRPNIILHIVSPDLSVTERRPWRVVLPGEMYPRASYSRICTWNGGWTIGPYRTPTRDHVVAELNDAIERRPW